MPRIHEMPTHLNVEDTLLGPLTPGQLVRLAAGLSLAYVTWDQLTVLPDPVRAALAGLLVLVGVLVACCRPAGVGLDAWALAALAFSLGPRRLAWARPEPHPSDWRQTAGARLGRARARARLEPPAGGPSPWPGRTTCRGLRP